MNQKSFIQFVVAIGLAGLGLVLIWSTLGVGAARAQEPDGWEKADLYGAAVEFQDFVISDEGDLYVCLGTVGYGMYKLAHSATSWQVLTSTGHGNCRSLAIDNANSKLYQIGGKPNQNLLRSDDSGLNWTRVYTPPDEAWSFGVMAINPVTPTILHITLHDYGPGGSYTDTIHRSENSGVDWTQAQFSLDEGVTYSDTVDSRIRQIAVDPGNPQYVYLSISGDGDDDGIYVSANGGLSYTRVITFDPRGYRIGVNISGTVFASYNDAFWRSQNHGQTWQWLDINADCNDTMADNISFHPALSPTVFIDSGGGRVCRSDDEGDSWGELDFWRVPLIDPSITSTWYAADRPGVWKSTDMGNDWFEMNEGLAEVAVRRIGTNSDNPDHYWAMTENGVGFTRDGGDSWKFPLRIYEDTDLEEIDEYILSSRGGEVVFHPTISDKVYVAQRNRLYIFYDDDWQMTPGWDITPTHSITINAAKPELSAQDLVIDPTNPLTTGYLAAGHQSTSYNEDGDGVYTTTNGGLTWNTTSLTLPIRSLALVTHTNGVTVYAGTMDADGIPGRIYRSADGGSSWDMLKELADPDRSITTMAVDPRKPLHIFAGAAGKGDVSDSFFYISQDGGENWNLANFGQYKSGCGGWVADIAIDTKNPDHIYFAHANNGNLCYSKDGGQTWELPSFIWSQQWGVGQANVVDINHLPQGISGSGLSVQAEEVITQSLMLMGTTGGVYSRILVDEGGIYLPIILKASS